MLWAGPGTQGCQSLSFIYGDVDPENTMLRREADTGHTGCDSTNGKRSEQAKPQTQTVGSWSSGAREAVRVTAEGDGASFRVMDFFLGCAGSSLLHVGFLQLQCAGFSCCRVCALEYRLSSCGAQA